MKENRVSGRKGGVKKNKDDDRILITAIYKCPVCDAPEFETTREHGTRFRCKTCRYVFLVPLQLTKEDMEKNITDDIVRKKMILTCCTHSGCGIVYRVRKRNLQGLGKCAKCKEIFIIENYQRKPLKEVNSKKS